MAGEIYATVVGNLGDDPEMRFTASGVPVCQISIANTPRVRDNVSGEWKEADPTWVRVVCWRSLAQNVAESLRKGDRVVAYGKLENRAWEDKEGGKRYTLEMQAEAVGPDLTWVTAPTAKGVHEGAKERKRAARKEDPFLDDQSGQQPPQQAQQQARRAPANADESRASQAAQSPADDWS